MGIFVHYAAHFFPLVFSQKRKHLDDTIYFPSSTPSQIHYKKVFLPIFPLKFSIYLISPSNKPTLEVYLSGSLFYSFSFASSRQNCCPYFYVSHLCLSLNFLHNLIKQALEIQIWSEGYNIFIQKNKRDWI